MKHTLTTSIVLLMAAALLAQAPPQTNPPTPPPAGVPGPEAKPPDEPLPAPEAATNVTVDFGLQTVNNDTGSAKFTEYRDVPKEPVLPQFRLFSNSPAYHLELVGENTARTDQRYRFRTDFDWIRVNGDYNQIPHRFGIGHTLEQPTSTGNYQISDTLQQAFQNAIAQQFNTNKAGVNYPFLLGLVTPSLNAASPIDIALLRKRALLDVNLFPTGPVNTHVTYFVESRSGSRAAGTSFGFSNVVETPEPINYRTTDLGVSGEMPFTGGLLRGGLRVNRFQDSLTSFTFDNPFRATSATDASAYTAPGSGSIGGAAFGRIGLPPDNKALNGTVGVVYKLPMKSRITADVNLGQWRQDDTFIPYTTNDAITSPINATDINTLPAHSLNGKVNTTGATLQLTSSPVNKLNLSARYRYYDFDNRTPRITFPGYVRFDAVWEPIGRINVPFSFKNSRADVMASYDLGAANVEAGFRSETAHHTFREVDRSTENVWHVGTDFRPLKWAIFRASYEAGNRSINGYDPENAEDASFTTPQPPAQPETVRRFDVNARRISRIVSNLQLNPGNGNLNLDFNYVHNLDKYKGAILGLQQWKNNAFTTEADYAPSDRWNTYAFYSNESLGGIQIDEQNSSGVISNDPKNQWMANNTDKVNSYGAGLNFGIVPNKIDMRLTARYQRANGTASLSTVVTPSNLNPRSIPNLDDTKLWTTSAEAAYHVKDNVELAVGGWVEKYELNDAESSNLPNYVPGSFFLSPNFQNYRGKVAYVRTSYRW